MLTILKAHLVILNELKLLLEKEKKILIQIDEEKLIQIIIEKRKKIDKIELVEKQRREAYDEISFKVFVKKNNEAKEITFMIKNVIKDIKSLQETNMMLTKQSMDYSLNLMNLVQKTLKKSNLTYGNDGKVRGSHLGVKGSLNQSV